MLKKNKSQFARRKKRRVPAQEWLWSMPIHALSPNPVSLPTSRASSCEAFLTRLRALTWLQISTAFCPSPLLCMTAPFHHVIDGFSEPGPPIPSHPNPSQPPPQPGALADVSGPNTLLTDVTTPQCFVSIKTTYAHYLYKHTIPMFPHCLWRNGSGIGPKFGTSLVHPASFNSSSPQRSIHPVPR